MNTDFLIATLAGDLKPVPPRSAGRRLMLGIGGGGAITLLIVATALGFRPDLAVAMHGFSFWMKWTYTLSLGIGSVMMVSRLSRPEPVRLAGFWPIFIPFGLLAAVSIAEMSHVAPADWLAMWLGHSWKVCPWLVLILSLPIFVGLLWSFKRLAPTRLRAAGGAAGLASGAWAATLYCLHCPEVSALFVLTWYSLGIALASALGAFIGPRFISW